MKWSSELAVGVLIGWTVSELCNAARYLWRRRMDRARKLLGEEAEP